MNKETAKELLESQKKEMKENLKIYKKAEIDIDKDLNSTDILGPRDKLEYQRMLKDMENSENDK